MNQLPFVLYRYPAYNLMYRTGGQSGKSQFFRCSCQKSQVITQKFHMLKIRVTHYGLCYATFIQMLFHPNKIRRDGRGVINVYAIHPFTVGALAFLKGGHTLVRVFWGMVWKLCRTRYPLALMIRTEIYVNALSEGSKGRRTCHPSSYCRCSCLP